MEMTIEAKRLSRIIGILGCAVPTRTRLPQLAIELNGHAELITTDTELTVRALPDCGYSGEGRAAVDFRALKKAVSGAKGAIDIGLGESIRIGSSVGAQTLPAEPIEDTHHSRNADGTIGDPITSPLRHFDEPENIEHVGYCDGAALAAAVRAALPAIDDESTRYALNGVCLEYRYGCLSVVATDGCRLHYSDVAIDASGPAGSWIVIAQAARALTMLDSGQVQILTTRFGLRFVAVDRDNVVTLDTRLVEGRFPRWRDILPETQPMRVVSFARKDLAAVCDRIHKAGPTDEDGGPCREAMWEIGGLSSAFTSDSAAGSRVEAELRILSETRCEEVTKFSVDARFLREFARAVDGERIECAIHNQGRSGYRLILTCGAFRAVVLSMG